MTAERIYRALLALYPRAFRDEFGAGMTEAFRDLHRAHVRHGAGFWLFLAADICRSACAEHVMTWTSLERRVALQWIAACALGATVCGALGSVVTWSFSYFYHPYLEGAVLIPWIYGATLGTGLGLVQVAVLRRRVRLPIGWILVTAFGAAVGVELAIAVANRAGASGYALVFGLIVAGAQWLVARTRMRRAGWWLVVSAGALSLMALVSGPALNRTVAGMNPLSASLRAVRSPDEPAGTSLLLRGLYAPMNAGEFALGFAVMATTGLIVGAVTAKPVSSMLSRAR